MHHPREHDREFTVQRRREVVDVEFAIATRRVLSSVKKRFGVKLLRGEPSSPFLTPLLLELDVERTKELSAIFALVSSSNDANATEFKVLGRKRSNTAQATK